MVCVCASVCCKEFELALDSSQAVRLQCYGVQAGMDLVLGRATIELSRTWLDQHKERKQKRTERTERTERTDRTDAAEGQTQAKLSVHKYEVAPGLWLLVSARYLPPEHTIRRVPSQIKSGLFGVPLHLVIRYDIPLPHIILTHLSSYICSLYNILSSIWLYTNWSSIFKV